jgi:hypothetical protein
MKELASTSSSITKVDAWALGLESIITGSAVSEAAFEATKSAARELANIKSEAADPYADRGIFIVATAIMAAINAAGIVGTKKVATDQVTAKGNIKYVTIATAVSAGRDTLKAYADEGHEWASLPNPSVYALALLLRAKGMSSNSVTAEKVVPMLGQAVKYAGTLLGLAKGPKEAVEQLLIASIPSEYRPVLTSVIESIDAPALPMTPAQEMAAA